MGYESTLRSDTVQSSFQVQFSSENIRGSIGISDPGHALGPISPATAFEIAQSYL